MTRAKTVLAAFTLLLAVFLTTHLLKFPGSLARLMEVTQGRKILDMEPSFSADESYRRLEEFGEDGRRAYRRTILTIDLVFPLSAFAFLFLWGRFAAERWGAGGAATRALLALSVAYLALDFVENASVLAMLSRFPERLEFLGGHIGYVTRGKRLSMLGALLLPGLLLLGALARRPARNFSPPSVV